MNPKNLKPPFFSIVIPAYNEEETLAITLKSLKKQDYQGKFEIIVVDNNSTDHTSQVAQKYADMVVFEANKGTACARQAGFKKAKGSIIVSTDADVLFPQNWLSKYAEEFNKHPQAIIISGMYDFYDGSFPLKILDWLFNYRLFCIFGWYSGANMAVKKWAFEKSSGFKTTIPISEDSELGVRLREFGEVYRFAKFKVHVSARRFNKLGLWAALWNYGYTYFFQYRLGIHANGGTFKSGSEVKKIGFMTKLTIQILVITILLISLLGGIFEIKPVRAQVIKREHQLKLQLSKVDIDLPSLNTFHHVHH